MTNARQRLPKLWWAALLGVCVVLVAPLLIVDVPPLLDYPNHLARVFVLASLPDDRVLAQFFTPHWSIIPNLALDLIAPPLIHILPVHVAGRLLVAAAILLPVLGTIAYGIALGGRWWPLAAGLLGYNNCLLEGFLNFALGIGLALLCAAAWLHWRETRPVLAVTIACLAAPSMFACHLMGLVFFAALAGGCELSRIAASPRPLHETVRRGIVLLLVFATPATLYALSALQGLGGDAEFLPPGRKLLQLITIFANYNRALDVATAIFCIGLPLLCLAARRGAMQVRAAIPAVLLLLTFLAAPYAWKGTYALDTRLAIMLGFMLFAGFVPRHWPRRASRSASAAVVALLAARLAFVCVAWSAHAADVADVRAALAPVRPGQAVYVAEAGLAEAPAYWAANPRWRLMSDGRRIDEHIGALALIEHRAWWPFEFDIPSQQPIETLQPYAAMAERVGSLPNRDDAARADVCGFDWILLIAADAVAPLPPDRFRLAVQAGYASLYQITRCRS